MAHYTTSTVRAKHYLQHVPFIACQRDRRRLIPSHSAKLLTLLLLPCELSLISTFAIFHHVQSAIAQL